jgi:hypothetical protein
VHGGAAAGVTFFVMLAAMGCARTEDKAAPEIHAAERPVLAQAANQAGWLGVQVLDARRVGADTLRIDLAVENRAAAAGGPAQPTAEVQRAMATLADVSLLSADGRRRVFPLRDGAGQVVWSRPDAPAPGQRRQLWVLFPAPAATAPGEKPRITLVVPGMPPMRGIPVS